MNINRAAAARQMPVKRRGRDIQPFGHSLNSDLRIAEHRAGGSQIILGKGWRPAAQPSPVTSGFETGIGSFSDDRALELGQRSLPVRGRAPTPRNSAINGPTRQPRNNPHPDNGCITPGIPCPYEASDNTDKTRA